jgi:hypothetical protein
MTPWAALDWVFNLDASRLNRLFRTLCLYTQQVASGMHHIIDRMPWQHWLYLVCQQCPSNAIATTIPFTDPHCRLIPAATVPNRYQNSVSKLVKSHEIYQVFTPKVGQLIHIYEIFTVDWGIESIKKSIILHFANPNSFNPCICYYASFSM